MKKMQKMRIIINDVSFFTTVKQIRAGVGDHTSINKCARQALEQIELIRKAKDPCVGLVATFSGHTIQMDML